jgi:hypothetical protein
MFSPPTFARNGQGYENEHYRQRNYFAFFFGVGDVPIYRLDIDDYNRQIDSDIDLAKN